MAVAGAIALIVDTLVCAKPLTAPKLRLFGAAVERKMNIDPSRSFRQHVAQAVSNLDLTEPHVLDNCYDKL